MRDALADASVETGIEGITKRKRGEGILSPFLFFKKEENKKMDKLSGLVVACTAIALISIASANVAGPEGLPEQLYAGSEITLTYTIYAGEPGPIKIDFSVSSDTDKIEWNETTVHILGDGGELNCTEYEPCHFDCNEYNAGKTSIVEVTFSSLPNLKPQEYSVNCTAKYKGEQVTVTRRTGGRGNPDIDGDGINNTDELIAGTDRHNPCDPNPYNEACYLRGGSRPTPTPSPTPTPEVTPEATSIPELTATPTTIATVSPERKFPWWIFGVIGAGLASLGAWLWRRRQNK